MPDFIGPDLWPPNSSDVNLVDYEVWGVMQQRLYECRMNSVDELKLRLIDVWSSLQQNVIDWTNVLLATHACSQLLFPVDWRKQLRACMHACRWTTFWHLLQAHVTNKSYGQIKCKALKKVLLYCWTCDFRGLKVSQGKVHTINRWGGISNHLSMAYLLSNICTKNYWNRTTSGWVVSFLRHSVHYCIHHTVSE